jgi:hypothetical protein
MSPIREPGAGRKRFRDRGVEADHERPERVVDRLRCQLACLDLTGELGDKLADRVYRKLAERRFAESGQEALSPRDLVARPSSGLEVRTPAIEPPRPQ